MMCFIEKLKLDVISSPCHHSCLAGVDVARFDSYHLASVFPKTHRHTTFHHIDQHDYVAQNVNNTSCDSGPHAQKNMLINILNKLSLVYEIRSYCEPGPNVEVTSVKYIKENGIVCKNLFLKDRKGQYYLVVFPYHKKVDLKLLRVKISAYRNFSFGSAKELESLLKIEDGVTPFGLMFDVENKVRLVVDTSLANASAGLLNFHPFQSNETILLGFDTLDKFVQHYNHCIELVDMFD